MVRGEIRNHLARILGSVELASRESIVRVDQLVGEIVRLAPAQAANSQIEAALKDNTEFVRKKIGDHEVITTRAIIGEEEAIIGSVKAGTGKKAALIAEAEYRTPARRGFAADSEDKSRWESV